MAIDIVARGMAASLLGANGRLSADKMPTINAAPEGTQFYPVGALDDPSLLEGKTTEEILMIMMYGIISPKLSAPSLSVNITSPTLATIGRNTIVEGDVIFDRGSITPAYGTSGMRAGEIERILINNIERESHFSFEFIPTEEISSFNCDVFYKEGEQPLNSIGGEYDAPYPAGKLSVAFEIPAIYPVYTQDNQAEIEIKMFEDEDGNGGYEATISAETEDTKQSFAIAKQKKIIGIQQFEPYTKTWMWIGGSPEASLTYFDASEITLDGIDYVSYIHNGSMTGARELRIYIEEE